MFSLFKKKAKPVISVPPAHRSQLVPRIKHVHFLTALQEHGVPLEQQPTSIPLCGELLVTYAFDTETQFIMVSPQSLQQAGIAMEEVSTLALQNLARLMPTPQYTLAQGVSLVETGGDLEATLLLQDGICQKLQADVKGELVAAVPRRNRMLFCDSANLAALAFLRSKVQDFFTEEQDAHALSLQLMVRRENTWQLLDEQ